MKARYYGLGVLSTLLVVAIIWLGVLVVENTRNLLDQLPTEENAATGTDLTESKGDKWYQAKVKDIDRQLHQRYIEKIDKKKMYESALKAYVEG